MEEVEWESMARHEGL